MIRSLRVRDLAVIEDVELELAPGLSVVTGETGAGKSMLVLAVELLSGRRVSAEQVRSGAREACVEAILCGETLLARARERGLADPSDEELLISRSLSRTGRGRVLVGGRLATVRLLGEIVGDAVEVVSQRDHQRLLRPEFQTELLDAFGGLESELAAVGRAHAQWVGLHDELRERSDRATERRRREDQLRFEIEQIESVAPEAGELESLEGDRLRLAQAERLIAEVSTALEALDGEGGARERTAESARALAAARAIDPALAPGLEGLERAGLELEEAAFGLSRYRAGLEEDPARLERVESRLHELRRLEARYGEGVPAILDHLSAAREELERIGGGEERTRALEVELAGAAAELDRLAAVLEKGRRQASDDLRAAVALELGSLELARARFELRLERVSAKRDDGTPLPSGPRGRERASFLLAANPGEELRALRDAASGGELARLLLALRNALRDAQRAQTLVFDEVDAGVGGRTALRIGERLRALSATHQVICITHLPQIAAAGQHHFRVSKRVRDRRTRTRVTALDPDERIDEIARMAGGGKVTAAARAHARELLGGPAARPATESARGV